MFSFQWQVPENGFEWISGQHAPAKTPEQDEEYLVAAGEGRRQSSIEFRVYEPLSNSGLFKEFAKTEPTKEGILSFANRYGTLGGSTRKAVYDREYPKPPTAGSRIANGQPFWFWQREILAVRHATAIWEATNSGDEEFISQFVQWNADGSSGFEYTTPTGWKMTRTAPTERPDIDAMLVRGDLITPAKIANREHINMHLVSSRLLPQLVWERVSGKPRERIRFQVGDLISAIWLQLAQAIDGNREFSQCDECGRWYEVSGDRRADARFCSDPCRFRAYRKRQKEAVRLHASGLSVKEISTQLGSDVKTIKGWIARTGGRKG